MSKHLDKHVDILVIGAGMVGSALVCALNTMAERHGWKLLLLESAAIRPDEMPQQPGFDARSTALSSDTTDYLKQLGLWPELQKFAEPILKIHVSDRGHFGAVRLDSAEYGLSALGHVIENASAGYVFNQALLSSSHVDIRDQATVTSLVPEAQGMQVNILRDGQSESVSARLVVLAEGGRSGLSESIGISRRRTEYGQSAIIANVSFSDSHSNIAYERFTASGPLALLPLCAYEGQHRAALVWSHPHDQIEAVMALDDQAFLSHLQDVFGNRVGRFTRVGSRTCYPLSLVAASEQYRRGLVLVGNVAQSLHPVAGQGFNLALRNAMVLAETLNEAESAGEELASPMVLERYAERVGPDQQRTVMFSDYLTRLFSSDNKLCVWLRQSGMVSIDLLPPLKRQLISQAAGHSAPLASVLSG